MDKKELKTWIEGLLKEGKLYKFYKSAQWLNVRERILKESHYECEWCREKGKISKAETVHHMQYVKKHPEQALDEYYTYKGKRYRNLVPLCHDCHDMAHERMKWKKREEFNEERW